MRRLTYLGRKITARQVKNRHGGKDVEVKINGVFAWIDSAHGSTEERSIGLACRYIDDAIERPGAYPVLD